MNTLYSLLLIHRPRRLLAARRGLVSLWWGALLLGATTAAAQAPVGTPGLNADYYRGYFSDALLFFQQPAAIANRPIEQLNFPQAENDNFGVGAIAVYNAPGNPDEFSGYFQGQLYVLTPGQYSFYLGSDDAAYLWLDADPQALASNKGDQQGFREAVGTSTLTAGLHTLRVAYGEHGGSQGLVLQYSGPNLPKQLIPNGVLYTQQGAIQPTLSELELTADQQQRVQVQWSVVAERNCQAYVVQRSTDGMVFETMQRQASVGVAPHTYEFLDPRPAIGQNFYRIQQLRSDRPPVYSPVLAVEVKPVTFILSVYPVPNNGNFYLQVPPLGSGSVGQLKIVDIAGHLVYQQSLLLEDGQPHFVKPALAVGIYRLFLTTERGTFSQKLSLDY
ncbi:MAG: PA14 domain-containing protein [Janthinobacterium lividum]